MHIRLQNMSSSIFNFKLYFLNSGRLGTQAEDGGGEQSLEGKAGPRGKRAS